MLILILSLNLRLSLLSGLLTSDFATALFAPLQYFFVTCSCKILKLAVLRRPLMARDFYEVW